MNNLFQAYFTQYISKKLFLLLLLLSLIVFLVLLLIAFLVGRNSIHAAIMEDDINGVVAILNHDVRTLERRDRIDLTPLNLAVKYDKLSIATLLIQRGANVNAKWNLSSSGDGNWTTLHIAAVNGNAEMGLLLIQSGAEINSLTSKGETPLDVAIRNNSRDFAKLLMDHNGVKGAK